MDIIETKLEEFTSVEVRGRIDSTTFEKLQNQLSTLARSGCTGMAVDLRQVAYMSSAGFKALLIGAKLAAENRCGMTLYGISGEIRRLFEIGGFEELFVILPGLDECIAHLKSEFFARSANSAGTPD